MKETFIILILLVVSIAPLATAKSRVLVVGGTGMVGREVVRKLIEHGVQTSVLSRTPETLSSDPLFKDCTLHRGDVSSMDSLLQASSGCDAIISLQSPKPRRVSKVSDLWSHPREDSNHPYSVNYLGMKRILAAMKINNINRLIRITGALTTKNAFSPFVFLFNFLGSFRVKWNELSEIDIRRSGVDYTVIRPAEIVRSLSPRNESSPTTTLVTIQSAEEPKHASHTHTSTSLPTSPSLPPPLPQSSPSLLRGPVTMNDLSSLIVTALSEDRLRRTTVFCVSEAAGRPGAIGFQDWKQAIAASNLRPDVSIPRRQHHRTAFFMYMSLLTAALSVISSALAKIAKKLLAAFIFS